MSRLFAILIFAASALNLRAAETNAVAEAAPLTGVDQFQLIWKRNIFDPQRARDGEAPPPTESEHVPVVDSFTLLGSMSYEKGKFAFFDGTSSDYRKTLEAGGKIGGFTIAEIDPAKVVLESAEKKIDFPVGAQMKRADKGEWKFNERSDYVANSPGGSSRGSSSSSSSYTNRWDRDRGERRDERSERSYSRSESRPSTSSSSSPPSSSGSSGDMSEVLKRLMQQREQELKK